MSAEETRPLLKRRRDELAAGGGPAVPDPVLERVLELAREKLPRRYFPGRALDLLAETAATAAARGAPEAAPADAEAAARRLAGNQGGAG